MPQQTTKAKTAKRIQTARIMRRLAQGKAIPIANRDSHHGSITHHWPLMLMLANSIRTTNALEFSSSGQIKLSPEAEEIVVNIMVALMLVFFFKKLIDYFRQSEDKKSDAHVNQSPPESSPFNWDDPEFTFKERYLKFLGRKTLYLPEHIEEADKLLADIKTTLSR